MYEIETVTNILDEIIAYEVKFRKRQELVQANADRLRDEAIELMAREPKVEPDEDQLTDEARERRI
jgi:hypothetical protein